MDGDLPIFSEQFETLLALLTPGDQPTGRRAFPAEVQAKIPRLTQKQDIHEWFKGCVDGPLRGSPEFCAVEPNLAVFATVGWKEGGDLTYANVSVLKTQTSLEDYYCDPSGGAFYLRLDLDYGTLGPAFTHALPHVHNSSDDSAPRFAMEGPASDNVVMDFFEFSYRHFLPDRWLAWARAVWRRAHKSLPPEEDPFDSMMTAFKESKIEVLRSHAASIATLKRLLREEKDRRYRPRANRSDMELLRYPL